jgi:hypothetical protein
MRWPNLNSTRLTEDSEQPKQRLQGGNDIGVPPPPYPRTDLGFPTVLEAGEHGQGHDDASKKVTAPTGVAVVSNMQGFRPGLSTTPKTTGQAHKELPFSTLLARVAQERQLAEKEALLAGPPPQKDGTRRWSSSPPLPRIAAITTTMPSSQ